MIVIIVKELTFLVPIKREVGGIKIQNDLGRRFLEALQKYLCKEAFYLLEFPANLTD